jgi:hypothetical protein
VDSAGTCINCVWLQNQLSKVFEEIKSLKTLISLLQKEQGLSYTDLAQSERGKIDSPNSDSDMLQSERQCMVHENRQNKSITTLRNGNVQSTQGQPEGRECNATTSPL